MATKKLPDLSFVRECLDYAPDTGVFLWRERPLHHFVSARGWWQWNPKHAGKPAGTRHHGARGTFYWAIGLAGTPYLAHRIAWMLAQGVDPWPDEIDHIDGNPMNNRIANLRLATRGQNLANARLRRSGTVTGIKGVTVSSGRKVLRYDARVRLNGTTHYLGCFPTIEEAAEARREAAARLHGKFVRHK